MGRRRLIVTLYSRPGCHLCDEAREALLAIASDPGVELVLREVDIESDDSLLASYLERIPVLEVDGVVVSELEAEPGALRRALAHTVERGELKEKSIGAGHAEHG